MVFTSLGVAGQWIYDRLDARQPPAENDNVFKRISKSRFSPFELLSDEEYIVKLQHRILGMDADIAIIDEKVEELREQSQETIGETQQTEHGTEEMGGRDAT